MPSQELAGSARGLGPQTGKLAGGGVGGWWAARSAVVAALLVGGAWRVWCGRAWLAAAMRALVSSSSGLLRRRPSVGAGVLPRSKGAVAQLDLSHVPSLRLDNMNERLKEMQYAVRGEVPIRAMAIDRELSAGSSKYPFRKILYCNIGNPQSMGQPPLSFYRNVLSLVDNPAVMSRGSSEELERLFGREEVVRAKEILGYVKNTGAYSESQGVEGIRQNVARFIAERDGYPSEPGNIFLSNGASSSIQWLLTAIISGPQDAVMIPIPQYPIYTALIALLGGKCAGYFLSERTKWSLRESELERALAGAVAQGQRPRAFVLINPGNPTGNTLTYEDVATVVKFCHRHQLVLLADEVYQENTYNKEQAFVSAKKVAMDLALPLELASFHSTSKGFIGECGRRGGYMEMVNFDPDVQAQILKLASSALCSGLDGQVMTDLMVRGPPKGSKAHEQFERERDQVLANLHYKSAMLHERLNAIEGVSCQPLEGAMYAFPKLELPDAFVRHANKLGKKPDALYALRLLEETGICTVPGSGFEQEPGTYHIRMTFLPPQDELDKAMDRFADFHAKIMATK